MLSKTKLFVGSAPWRNYQNINARLFATQIDVKMDPTPTANNASNALPFSQIPGPTKLSFILSNMPGGKYYKMELNDMLKMWRKDYGDVLKIPGLFGNPTIILTHNPDDFQLIFRTEGPWPGRPTFESSDYFRRKIRPDIFGKYLGLANSQGKEWSDFRKIVNPIMIQPKTAKLYIPKINEVAGDMIDRIRQIRDTSTLQVPDNFEDVLNCWSLESICVIAMNSRLGIIGDNPDPRGAKFIASVKDFFDASFELEFRPSIWRFVATPTFKKLMRSLTVLTELATEYIEEAKKALEKEQPKTEDEQSVLEKLLKIDNSIATVMAMDMIFAGVDTTSSALSALIYLLAKNPDKQEILRQEILNVLPAKDSKFTIENMRNLPYLRACAKESMRLLPIVNGNVRFTGQDLLLSSYQVPKGTMIVMGTNTLQLEDKHYPKANEFLPERWLKQNSADGEVCPASAKSTHPFIYLPFGFGPRMCIGRRFAEMEIEILISKLVRNFQIKWEHPDLKFVSKTLNVPSGKLAFTFVDIDK